MGWSGGCLVLYSVTNMSMGSQPKKRKRRKKSKDVKKEHNRRMKMTVSCYVYSASNHLLRFSNNLLTNWLIDFEGKVLLECVTRWVGYQSQHAIRNLPTMRRWLPISGTKTDTICSDMAWPWAFYGIWFWRPYLLTTILSQGLSTATTIRPGQGPEAQAKLYLRWGRDPS